MYSPSMQTLKNIGAVLGGFLTVVILSIATDYVMETIGFFPPATEPEAYTPWMLFVALLYRSLFAVIGGYVTAKLAPRNTMTYVFVLGILGTVGGATGAIVAWDLGNNWYPIALAVTALPLTWWGGKLKH